jgi:adenylate cyclase
VAEPSRAVFLSYASQNAAAAERICAALRAAGVEVWFDRSELRGGDAWDRQIRKQVHDCGLFVPIISANTEARPEGYFRREWRLGVDRTQDMADDEPFLLPVVIDDTPDATARVPDKFREVQWARLRGGESAPAFIERVSRLLAHDTHRSSAVVHPPPTTVASNAAAAANSARALPVSRWSPLALVPLAAVTILVCYITIDRPWLSSGSSELQHSAGAVGQSAIEETSIAVLPFTDLSEKKDQEYFADGMAEEILAVLAKLPNLRVIARTSSFQFRGRNEDIHTIAAQLHVGYVLEGSVRRSGDQIRVTAQLIESRNGSHRWSGSYDRDAGMVLAVQDEIAAGIARALQVAMGIDESQAPRVRADAYEKYLHGVHAMDRMTQLGWEQAVAEFQNALELDPSFARAASWLAQANLALADYSADPDGARLENARQAALAALRLDPRLATAHAVLADVAMNSRDWASAERELNLARKLDERDFLLLPIEGKLAVAQGRWDEAIRFLNSALDADPLRALTHQLAAYAYLGAHRTKDAEAQMRRALTISPDFDTGHYDLAVILLWQGQHEAARKEIEREIDEQNRDAGLAMIHFAMGRKSDSDADLKRLIASSSTSWAAGVSQVYVTRGELDQAFAWLSQAYEQKESDLAFIRCYLPWERLRQDPRYRAFLKKMNLPG